jgi:hypothetical protein
MEGVLKLFALIEHVARAALTKKQFLITNWFVPGANQLIDGPNLGGVSGDGDQDRGRALGDENRPHFIGTSTTTT